jgi:hypothetical protein
LADGSNTMSLFEREECLRERGERGGRQPVTSGREKRRDKIDLCCFYILGLREWVGLWAYNGLLGLI